LRDGRVRDVEKCEREATKWGEASKGRAIGAREARARRATGEHTGKEKVVYNQRPRARRLGHATLALNF
jgi:hypothetical protein